MQGQKQTLRRWLRLTLRAEHNTTGTVVFFQLVSREKQTPAATAASQAYTVPPLRLPVLMVELIYSRHHSTLPFN